MDATRTTIKVCGVCRPEDAHAAVLAGADAIGVILASAPRQVSLDEAGAVFEPLPPSVARVGVFVDSGAAFVEEASARLGLDYAQFHGSETPEVCATAPVPVIKAFRIGSGFHAAVVDSYRSVIAFALFDTHVTGTRGGAGVAFAWDSVLPLPGGVPIVVAGGLHAGNVAEAMRTLRPDGVDVSSGVEARLREKDPDKLRAFCEAVRAADREETAR